ncbi:MAG TPA: DUF547 domain-containing protein [Deferrisomatales bacterium]|nr:DUF547 domain-containing protein [Deferrisomatales bacterium]
MRRLSILCVFLALAVPVLAAPKPDLWPRWQAHNPASTARVDHANWQGFLTTYVNADHPSGIYRVRYAQVSDVGRRALGEYLDALQATPVSTLNRAEQKAYWINLYNAVTVWEILEHYPVQSIREIKSGWFSAGPWDKKLVTVEGEKMSLNDIEHRVLRPIFADNRVHYAVNCASLGCPNLQPVPFTAANTEALLERAARAYVNHPRGARFEGGSLHLSSIYDWFQVDFGESRTEVLDHLRRYAEGALAARLTDTVGVPTFEYGYDWALNE